MIEMQERNFLGFFKLETNFRTTFFDFVVFADADVEIATNANAGAIHFFTF
jgi:hypothetical protein